MNDHSSHLEPLDENEECSGRPSVPPRSVSRNSDGRRGSDGPSMGRVMTRDMIIKALEKQGQRMPADYSKEEKLLAKQTHLHLNGHRISKLDALRPMAGLEVLYLYDNLISTVENLSVLKHLTHVYLQNNQISQLDGLSGLKSLQKLYLQGNQIKVVTGLHSVPALEELHLNKQRFAPGDLGGLVFDEECLRNIAGRLSNLCAPGCGIRDASLAAISTAGLYDLRRLDLSQNQLHDMGALEDAVRSFPSLGVLDLRTNPLTKTPKYRDSVILMSDSLATLDDEPITAKQREFLMRLNIQKMKTVLRAEEAELRAIDAGVQPQASGHQHGGTASSSKHSSKHNNVQLPSLPLHSRPPPRGAGFASGAHHQVQQSHTSASQGPSRGPSRSASGNSSGVPSIPSRGMSSGIELGVDSLHLGGR